MNSTSFFFLFFENTKSDNTPLSLMLAPNMEEKCGLFMLLWLLEHNGSGCERRADTMLHGFVEGHATPAEVHWTEGTPTVCVVGVARLLAFVLLAHGLALQEEVDAFYHTRHVRDLCCHLRHRALALSHAPSDDSNLCGKMVILQRYLNSFVVWLTTPK